MRALKALVIFMGILILLGMGLVGYAIVNRVAAPEGGKPGTATVASGTGAAAPAKPFGPVEIGLPAGAKLARTSVSGDRLIVELALAAGGERLLVVDLASGAVIGTVDLKPQSP